MMEFDVAAARRVGERWGASDAQIGAAAAGVLLLQACDEIERLRLTDAERYAVIAGLRSLERTLYADPDNLSGKYRDMRQDAATLHGLLTRTALDGKRDTA